MSKENPALKYTRDELWQVCVSFARELRDWRLVALMSLLLNIWLAHIAGVL